ncbi:N-methyl-L-tryptophan oxidase [Francisella sp. Scap27]|uniref:N-methyl-L-tryptophan oxidase n=1 Tax=Francisella sp. Scap27 TaxID=2589986 RepID=UPI0015C1320E|nr:N-methyl-L-tryptophan oxidase [Francisella sp. Scap27]QLE79776.1 N-methyl-L-tryptophan oxidase [Francisella sp. Scap27]
MKRYDVIVVGLGAMGASSLYQLSKEQDLKILGIEQFAKGHENGSSHGETRIVRQAIGEGNGCYTTMAKRSYEILDEIESKSGKKFAKKQGLLLLFNDSLKPKGGKDDFLAKTIQQAKLYNINHQIYDENLVYQKFPFLVEQPELGNYFEPGAACISPEDAIHTQLKLATENGANINYHEEVLSLVKQENTTIVKTTVAEYEAKHVILTAGAWLKNFVEPKYKDILKAFVQKIYWFEVEPEYEDIFDKTGPFLIGDPVTNSFIYAMPSYNKGLVKFGFEEFNEEFNLVDTPIIDEKDISNIYKNHISPNIKGIKGVCDKAKTCIYIITPDYNFIIDDLSHYGNVTIISACSGHGFKHSFSIGEAMADKVCGRKMKIQLDNFSIDRF